MTDLNDRLAAMLDGEPTAPYDMDRVVAAGRRSLRRRSTLTAVAGTAGTAAVTAAIVVPLATSGSGGSGNRITVSTQPTLAPKPRCEIFHEKGVPDARSSKVRVERLLKVKKAVVSLGDIYSFRILPGTGGEVRVEACTKPKHSRPSFGPTTPAAPAYDYSADPRTISTAFGDELTKQVKALGFSVVYTAPFSQESSTLEKGHPTYFGGNVDVQLPDGPADIGVQVTHAVTELVPFDGTCKAPDCTQTTLPDGSLEQVSHIHSGSGGAMVIAVEIHHPDGLVVEAQEANYAFGPEATKARSSQPLTIAQLTTLAEDPAFTF